MICIKFIFIFTVVSFLSVTTTSLSDNSPENVNEVRAVIKVQVHVAEKSSYSGSSKPEQLTQKKDYSERIVEEDKKVSVTFD